RHRFRGELYTPPQTPHVVAVHVQDAPRLIQGRDGRCQEAPAHKDDALIVRAGQPTFWYGKDLSPLNIALDPAFLQRVALETCGSDPGRIELCDVFSTRDPTLARLAWLCCTELQTGGLGGQRISKRWGSSWPSICCAASRLPRYSGKMMSHVPCFLQSPRKVGSRCMRVAVRHDHGSGGASCVSACVSR